MHIKHSNTLLKHQCIHRFFQTFNDLKCIKNHIIMNNIYTQFDILINCHFFGHKYFLKLWISNPSMFYKHSQFATSS
jgi:hypothetical protein